MPYAPNKLGLSALAIAGALLLPTQPQAGISIDLAKRCRALAIDAFPTQSAGQARYAEDQRRHFSTCVARNGDMPNQSETTASGRSEDR
jgi:hypothetical protein